MLKPLSRYAHWLHLQWPRGSVERLPVVGEHGRTRIPGVYIVGDLTGIPLLKMALQSGAAAIRDAQDMIAKHQGSVDVVVVGAGVAGVSAAIEAKKQNLSVKILESNQIFSTIANFPKGKPIFTYPSEMNPESTLQVSATIKEALLEELQEQAQQYDLDIQQAKASHISQNSNGLAVVLDEEHTITCKTVIIAIGRSGNYRRLGVAGEELDKVSNRLHDPAKLKDKDVLVVGGGDSACETAIAIAEAQTDSKHTVTLAYRGSELSRPKAENVERILSLAKDERINLQLGTQASQITANSVTLKNKNGETELPNQAVFAMIGREAPLEFFRRSGLAIHGEYSALKYLLLISFFVFITVVYGMKGWIGPFADLNATWFNPGTWVGSLSQQFSDPQTLLGTIFHSARSSSFWVTIAYSAAVVGFGIARIRRRKTPYVTLQTSTLMAIQVIPLFLLPEIILPWMGANGWIPEIVLTNLFPDGSYWRAYGFILAWPLMVWNIFTADPLWWWVIIGFVQTFVLIPLLVWRWGKGAYCGWICSCGALAETMGDQQREKMPHGLIWNKLNFIGQGLLLIAMILLVLTIISWINDDWVSMEWLMGFGVTGFWKHTVDFFLAGALGTGLYFWFSGRVWCRFACPLAALMHIYARFSKFRIVTEQHKCISCNACTSVCHQGIDIMNFANKGKHMEDPECVRCSACVQTCPTGVLQFGQVDKDNQVTKVDTLGASPVVMREQDAAS